ncbi:MAG: sugar phosphate isomerase/epimerase family protein [Thermoleophilia bacterium]
MSDLKLAYNSNGMRLMPLDVAAEELSRIGYRGIEISLDHSHLHPSSCSLQSFSEIKQRLGNLGMPVCAIHTGAKYALGGFAFEPSLISVNEYERTKRISFIMAAIDTALWLGSPVCTVTSGFLPSVMQPEKAEELLLEALDDICNYAADDLTVCIEAEPGMYVGSTEKAVDIRNKLGGRLSLTLDIGHAVCNQEDPRTSLSENYSAIKHIHLEDIANQVHEHLIPGTGEIDFHGLISMVSDINYDGFVSVELYTCNDRPVEAAQKSYLYLQQIALGVRKNND